MKMQIEKNFYNENHRPYYILAPAYARVSNGIRAMHLLCHYLNKLGEEAYIVSPLTEPSLRTPFLTQEILERHKASNRDPIAIYPEVVHGNPLRANAVVRYILNHPGLLGGPKEYDASDMLVFWQEDYVDFSRYPNPSYIFIPTIDTSIFNDDDQHHDTSRDKVLIYPGRYVNARNDYPALFENAVVITYEWPQSHEELARVLRQGRVLYTFANSAIISEALLCGCPVVVKETVFTQKPEDRKGTMQALDLPGATFDDSEAGIELARQQVPAYQEMYQQYQRNLLAQLEAFVSASQAMPSGNPNCMLLPMHPAVEQAPPPPEVLAYENWLQKKQFQPYQVDIHAERMVKSWGEQPRFIIMMPLTVDGLSDMMKTITSLAQQFYRQWQLILIADFDAPSESFLQSEAIGWLRIDNVRDPAQLTAAYAAVLNGLPCHWIAILPAGVELESNALLSLGDYAAKRPDWHAIYCDHDFLLPDGKRRLPAFKPDFNLDFYIGSDYVGPTVWFKPAVLQATGGFAEGHGADIFDAVLRIRDQQGSGSIGHIPHVLAHLPQQQMPEVTVNARANILAARFTRQSLPVEITAGGHPDVLQVNYPTTSTPSISVIVVDAGDGLSLTPCLDSMQAMTTYPKMEILVVSAASADASHAVRWIACDAEHTMLERYTLGANAAAGDYFLFIDSRVEMLEPDWLTKLLGIALRPEVGITAPRLLNEDGQTVWRGPYLLGADAAAAPLFCGAALSEPGYLNRQLVDHNPAAVTIDCLLIRKSVFWQQGGLRSSMPDMTSAAIDLCLRVRMSGALIVWTPHVSVLRHLASDAAGALSEAASDALHYTWRDRLYQDSAHNPNLHLDSKTAFMTDDIFVASWDVNFHDRLRVLAFISKPGKLTRHIRTPLELLQERGQCQFTLIADSKDLPSLSELQRLAPDVLFLDMRFEPAFIAWLQRCHLQRPDMRLVLMLDSMGEHSGISPRYGKVLVREAVAAVDHVLVATPSLLHEIGHLCEKAEVLPYALNENDWGSRSTLQNSTRKLRVGCINPVCAMTAESLQQLVQTTSHEIEWVVSGEMPQDWQCAGIEVHALDANNAGYPEQLANLMLDAVLMVAANEDFLPQLLEFGSLGLAVICTSSISSSLPEVPLLVAGNTSLEWASFLKHGANNRQGLQQQGLTLQSWVRANHMLEQILPRWISLLAQ